MKTNILRTACFAFIALLMSSFVTKAQEPFYNAKWEDGKMVSRTKYVMGNCGISVQESVSKFTYDENGDLLKKEVVAWNPKYEWNDKTGRWNPDYSESNWTPQYCILFSKDLISDFVSINLCLWNKKEKGFDNPVETMLFQLKDSNHFSYLAFQKGNKYDVVINNINYDRALLAKLAE